jgi:DNA-binding GntR family transcriptional regulator
MAQRKKNARQHDNPGTLAEQAHRRLKRSILRGEFPEGSFLSEAEVTARFKIGRTPFREACNRLHNEQLLEVVPRRGYLVPEMSFRAVRDLLEARLILEGVAAELAAQRAEPAEVAEFEQLYRNVLAHAKDRANPGEFVEANTAFHLHLARMAHNRELETMLRGVLERSTRLFYMIARASTEPERDARDLLAPVVEAVRRKDAAAGHQAVIRDITHGQMNVLGRDLWEKAR